MPFFQELDVEENRRAQQIAEINQRNEAKKKKQAAIERKNRQLNRQVREANGEKVTISNSSRSSSDSNGPGSRNNKSKSLNYALTRDDLFIYEIDRKKQRKMGGVSPVAAMNQKELQKA